MYTRQIPIADLFVKLLHHVGVFLGGSDVVAGSEEVAGVEANSDASLIFYQRDDGGQVMECSPNDVGPSICLDCQLRTEEDAKGLPCFR